MANGVTLTGDWRKLRHKFDRYTSLGEMMADDALYECAELVKDTLHKVVNSEPSPSNASQTVRRKGFDAPMYETGGMEESDSIVIDDYSNGSSKGYTVGGNPSKNHIRTGTSYEDIVVINSLGSEDIPARHMLEMAYDICQNDIERLTRKKVNDWLRS